MPHPVEAVQRAVQILLEQPDPAAARLAWALDAWLATGADLAECLGMARGWHAAWRQGQRDRALREMAARYFPALGGRPLARRVADAVAAYAARSWPRDRAARRRPDGLNGLAYDTLLAGPMPTEETLRKCIFLGNRDGLNSPTARRDCA
jgi:hypothetical protein